MNQAVPCQRCGVDVVRVKNGVPKYCPECRATVRREQGKAYDARRRPREVIGSPRACSDCGEMFVVTGGRQTVCAKCLPAFNSRRAAAWAADNRDARLSSVRSYNERNREEINRKSAERRKLPHVKERLRIWSREYDSRPKQRVDGRMAQAIRVSLKGGKNGRRWESLVGYTVQDLCEHLESLFVPGMSWSNMSEWHIDHVIPKVLFQYESAEDPKFKECWALSNLQPLWAPDNLSKGAKTDYLAAA